MVSIIFFVLPQTLRLTCAIFLHGWRLPSAIAYSNCKLHFACILKCRLPSAIAYSNCSLFELCRIELWLFLERPNGRSMLVFFQLDPSRVKQCLWLEFEGKL